jgi:hypothetical protein
MSLPPSKPTSRGRQRENKASEADNNLRCSSAFDSARALAAGFAAMFVWASGCSEARTWSADRPASPRITDNSSKANCPCFSFSFSFSSLEEEEEEEEEGGSTVQCPNRP